MRLTSSFLSLSALIQRVRSKVGRARMMRWRISWFCFVILFIDCLGWGDEAMGPGRIREDGEERDKRRRFRLKLSFICYRFFLPYRYNTGPELNRQDNTPQQNAQQQPSPLMNISHEDNERQQRLNPG